MTGFDFLFALFSLLLGLAMAEILGGFARVLKMHARHRAGLGKDARVGRLVPLLALFVLLSQLTFWNMAYAMRDGLPLNYVTLVGLTVVVGGYYLLSALVWPDDPADWPDFDLYYDQHNRTILIGNLVLSVLAAVASGIYGPPPGSRPPIPDTPLVLGAVAAVYLALAINVALIFVKSRRLNAGLLALLIAMQLGGSVVLVGAGLVGE